MIEKVLVAHKEKKLKPKVENMVNATYTMTYVLGHMKKEKPLSIQDLKTEINALKLEVVQLRRRKKIMELGNIVKEVDDD